MCISNTMVFYNPAAGSMAVTSDIQQGSRPSLALLTAFLGASMQVLKVIPIKKIYFKGYI